jgi:hypothetical protein
MAYIFGLLGRIFVLGSAFWLIVDMGLDTNQTEKYYRHSPQLNSDHEANSNLTQRILKFCGDLGQISLSNSVMTDPQKNLHDEWIERCRTANFSLSISYGIFQEQIESEKVSSTTYYNHVPSKSQLSG